MAEAILNLTAILMSGAACIAIAYGGVLWITAAGDPAATARAKHSLATGLTTILLAAIAAALSQASLEWDGIPQAVLTTGLAATIPGLAVPAVILSRSKPEMHPAGWAAVTAAALITWSLTARNSPEAAPAIMAAATTVIMAHTGLLIAGKTRGKGLLSNQTTQASAILTGINTGAVMAMAAASL